MILILISLLVAGMFPGSSDGLWCLFTDEPFYFSFDEFNKTLFEDTIKQFQSYDYYYDYDDDESRCRVEIFVDYASEQLVISFGNAFVWSDLENGEMRLDFYMTFINENTIEKEMNTANILEYACSHEDQCHQTFLFQHIDWLRLTNSTLLEKYIRPLLLSDNNHSGLCLNDNRQAQKCPSGICASKFSSDPKQHVFDCHPTADEPITLYITTYVYLIDTDEFEDLKNLNQMVAEEKQVIRYTCEYNLCNSPIILNELLHVVQQYYDLSSMRMAIGYHFDTFDQNQDPSSNSTTTTVDPLVLTNEQSFTVLNIPDYPVADRADHRLSISITLFLTQLFFFFFNMNISE